MNTLTKNEPRAVSQARTSRPITPRYEARENQDAYTITVFVPGAERSSLETKVDGEKLTIVGRRSWKAPENWRAVHREISQADYQLTLELDHRVNRDAIQAELSQGILTLTIPKAESVKLRKIEIKG